MSLIGDLAALPASPHRTFALQSALSLAHLCRASPDSGVVSACKTTPLFGSDTPLVGGVDGAAPDAPPPSRLAQLVAFAAHLRQSRAAAPKKSAKQKAVLRRTKKKRVAAVAAALVFASSLVPASAVLTIEMTPLVACGGNATAAAAVTAAATTVTTGALVVAAANQRAHQRAACALSALTPSASCDGDSAPAIAAAVAKAAEPPTSPSGAERGQRCG